METKGRIKSALPRSKTWPGKLGANLTRTTNWPRMSKLRRLWNRLTFHPSSMSSCTWSCPYMSSNLPNDCNPCPFSGCNWVKSTVGSRSRQTSALNEFFRCQKTCSEISYLWWRRCPTRSSCKSISWPSTTSGRRKGQSAILCRPWHLPKSSMPAHVIVPIVMPRRRSTRLVH